MRRLWTVGLAVCAVTAISLPTGAQPPGAGDHPTAAAPGVAAPSGAGPGTAPGAPAPAAAAPAAVPSTPSAQARPVATAASTVTGAGAAAGAGSRQQPRPSGAAEATEAPADTDQRVDLSLERLHDRQYAQAAASLYDLYRRLPDNDLRRDMVAFHMASALAPLGFVQAAVEHYLNIVTARRSPELIPKTLGLLQGLYEKRLVDETRFVDNLLFGSQFGETLPESADFIEYLQALGDLRHGFSEWGRSRLDALAKRDRPYSLRAKYLLAVERIAQKQDDGAEKLLRQVLANAGAAAPAETLNQCRLALARILYERKNYDEAWKYYSQIDSPLPLQDTVLLEKAWDRVASGDHERALGMLVGLGAPVFRRVFAPERDLIRALALRRLCQYRAAHLAVTEFRARYGATIAKIRNREPLADDPAMRQWATWNTALLDPSRMRSLLGRERGALGSLGDKELRAHLDQVYSARIGQLDGVIARGLTRALDRVSDELLRIEEQMNLIDYEMGAGLFTSGAAGAEHAPVRPRVRPSAGSSQVFFRFDDEYWSDELSDFVVITEDRCLH